MRLRSVLEHAAAAAIFERLLSEEREIVLAPKEDVVGQGYVNAGADNPTDYRSVPFRKADRIGLQLGRGDTCRQIGQNPAHLHADSTFHRAEQAKRLVEIARAWHVVEVALLETVAEFAFDAIDDVARLEIVASEPADRRRTHIVRDIGADVGLSDLVVLKGASTESASIESLPGPLGRRSRFQDVGRHDWSGQAEGKGTSKQKRFHVFPADNLILNAICHGARGISVAETAHRATVMQAGHRDQLVSSNRLWSRPELASLRNPNVVT